jgi:hypothetical protein
MDFLRHHRLKPQRAQPTRRHAPAEPDESL